MTLHMPSSSEVRFEDPEVVFNGSKFCFTGEIHSETGRIMTQKAAETLTKSLGGIVKNTAALDLDYLVVGPHQNKERVKIKATENLQQNGGRVAFITSSHWLKFIPA